MMITENKNSFVPELLLAFYLFGFTLLRPVLIIAGTRSSSVLFLFILALISVLVLDIIRRQRVCLNAVWFMAFCAMCVFILDYVFRNNSFSGKYLYEFIYRALVPIIILSQIKNSRKFLYYYSIFSVITFVIFCLDPLQGYKISGDYMDFGFAVAIPSFFGMYLACHYFKMRWVFPLEIFCAIETLVFANRSAFLSVIVFVLFTLILWRKSTLKRMVIYLVLLVSAFIVSVNISSLFTFTYDLVGRMGISSYALDSVHEYVLDNDVLNLPTGREEIWEMARDVIKERPLFGHGMGILEARWGFYSHSIYYDVILFYGYMGLIVVFLLLINSVRKTIPACLDNKILAVLFFCLWCPKLIFSTYFIKEPAFWCFIAFGFMVHQLELACTESKTK